jgi:hypothetical protein
MRKIWVVIGSTGEYSDRCEWLVRAFVDEKAAALYVSTLKTTYQQFQQNSCGHLRDDDESNTLEKYMLEFDPNFREDYTGTYYYIEESELNEDIIQ